MESTSGIPLVESTSGIYQWFSINFEGFLRFWGFLEDVGPRNDTFPWAEAMFPVVFGNAWISNGNGMLFCGNGGNDVIWALENQCFWNANADLQNHHYSIRNITVFVNRETQADHCSLAFQFPMKLNGIEVVSRQSHGKVLIWAMETQCFWNAFSELQNHQ